MTTAPSGAPIPDVMSDLTAFQRNVLVVLSAEPMYGLAIKRELEAYYGAEVNHGRLYPNLDTLVEHGLVDKQALDKRTNEYSLTDDGADAVLEQLEWAVFQLQSNGSYDDQLESLLEE
ncbi:MAG: PadR family transcriptional regulator [Natronomonas sp.]